MDTHTYTVPKDLFLLAFNAIDRGLVPATPVPNVGHVRALLNELEACAQDNERRAAEAAAQAERKRITAELAAAAAVQTSVPLSSAAL
jgi:hypothetical protein